ncbi:MAG: lysylphosphatidylglycerol synthase transmembrane domain-containing protein [Gammaproteobacteria bacterium]
MSQKKKQAWFVQAVGIMISIVCMVYIVRQINPQELKAALVNFNWVYLAVGLGSLSIGYVLRIIRWGVMLRSAKAHVNNIQCAAPFLGSIALNNVLPLRAGDVMRAFIFPASMGVHVSTSTASLFLERLLDLVTLLLCLATGLYFSQHVVLPDSIKTSIFVLAIIAFCLFFFMLVFHHGVMMLVKHVAAWSVRRGYAKLEKLFIFVADFFKRLSEMITVRHLIRIFGLSLCIWVFEAGLFKAILDGLHLEVGVLDVLGIMAIATLATLVPSSPGYVGPFHLVAYSALAAFHVSVSDAASFAIITHLALWVPTTLAGAVAILANRQLFQGV